MGLGGEESGEDLGGVGVGEDYHQDILYKILVNEGE